MPERPVIVPDVLQAPAPCPVCGHADRLFTPNAAREPYRHPPLYEPAWQCPRCARLDFIAGESTTTLRPSPGEPQA